MDIEYQVTKGCYVYIIQAYLPSSNHCMQEFEEYMRKLQDICSTSIDKGTVGLMGDLNAHQNGSTFLNDMIVEA